MMGKPPEMKNPRLLIACVHLALISIVNTVELDSEYGCPAQEKILPCRCSTRDMEFQIWCSHSELPKVLEGLKAVGRHISRPIDEVILENNNLPSLPGKAFENLRVLRLMLRNNRLERVSSGWLEGLHDSLLELFIVEPDLRSLPIDSLDNLRRLEAITLQSSTMKRLPKLSNLPQLRYLQINSPLLTELTPRNFRSLPRLEELHIFGSNKLTRLEAGLLRDLHSLSLVNISRCQIRWIHPRTMSGLPKLKEISLVGNKIVEAGMVGRAVMDLPVLSILRLDENHIGNLEQGSFRDLPMLTELHASRNRISEIFAEAFHRVPNLRVLDLNQNAIYRIHPEFVPRGSINGLEELRLISNDLSHVTELRIILDALPRLKFLDLSYNQFHEIPFGVIRGHPTLERLHLDHNRISMVQMEAFTAMPALRELRLRNNSLSNLLESPLWNLPALKGLDLAENYLRRVEPQLLANLPNLRRIDLSRNSIAVVDPLAFVANPALEHVNLSGNALSTFHPRTFSHLESLYELDVSWNGLTKVVPGLPRNIEHLHMLVNQVAFLPGPQSTDLSLPALRVLDLSGNRIKRLPPGSLATLPNLKKLQLGYNSIQHLESGAFRGLSRLEQLDLRHNRLVSLHENCLRDLRMLQDLNLQDNRMELITPDLFDNNARLQRLDLSMNRLANIPHASFANTRDLREVYTSHNVLTEVPRSVHGLASLEVLDLNFNKVNALSPETLSNLTSLLELHLAKNQLQELREGAFHGLPRLMLIDLEGNDLRIIEQNAVTSLPELGTLRLGHNRLQVIPNEAFVNLPLLQSVDLQRNHIEEIAKDAFVNVPQLLFLNLSHNLLPSLEQAGLESLNSLEVLDVSNNRVTRMTSESLSAMGWLVELKMDNNRICMIQGTPFDNMPRLRVLSLRNNRMASVSESAFKRLRSNIAVLDIDGNPFSCTCGMLWLRGWLQQESVEGPRCADGTLFREIRLSRQECQRERQIEPTVPGCESEVIEGGSLFGMSHDTAPWVNLKETTPSRPLPNESDYFYDDYVDYPHDRGSAMMDKPGNTSSIPTVVPSAETETNSAVTTEAIQPSTGGTATIYAAFGSGGQKNGTKPVGHKDIPPSPSSSGFTFFGVPLPSLNFNLWDNSKRSNERKSDSFGRPGRGRVQMYPPTEPKIQRGGFVPLPRGQTGFVPMVGPRDRYQMGAMSSSFHTSENETTRRSNEKIGNRVAEATGTNITKTSNATIVLIEKSRSKTPTISEEKTTRSKLTTVLKQELRGKPGSLAGSNGPGNVTGNGTDSDTRPDKDPSDGSKFNRTSVSTETRETKLVVDVPLPRIVSGEVASKIVWTTPRSDDTDQRATVVREIETTTVTRPPVASTTKVRDSFWVFTDSTTRRPTQNRSTTTTMSAVRGNRLPLPIEYTGVQQSSTTTSQDQLMPTTEVDPNALYATTPMTRTKEASPLSALLVPGGQVPAHQPLGRSRITKVSAPTLSPVAEQYHHETTTFDKNRAHQMLQTLPTPSNLLEQIDSQDLNGRFSNDTAFNWYFEHYTDPNLQPYIELADNNSAKQQTIARIHLYILCLVIVLIEE